MILDARVIILLVVAVALILLLWKLIYGRKAAEPQARFRKVSTALLADFLFPMVRVVRFTLSTPCYVNGALWWST